MTHISYTAPPTVARFMRSEAFFRVIMGPVGSGKTTGCIFELLRRAIEQQKSPDGMRYTRYAVVRQTLKQIKDTVLKDVEFWLRPISHYKVSDNTITIKFDDVHSEWLLLPLDEPDDIRRLLSTQLTGAWLSEAIEIDPGVVPGLLGRCGRFPGGALGGCTWQGAIADTNFPTEGGDWHKLFELELPPDWQVFKQPSGLAPDAENLEWLNQTPYTLTLPLNDPQRRAQGRIYYERLARGNSEEWITRYVKAQYGNDPSGSAVFRASFRKTFHCVRPSRDERHALKPIHGHPLIVAQDFGRNPCALIGQLDHRGRLLVFQELVSEDMGLELHINRVLRPALMDPRFFGHQVYVIGDPAGRQRSTSYEETSFDLLKRAGLLAYPAPTNDVDKRIRAVEAFLEMQRDGGPGLVIDELQCPKLVRALNGMYRYVKRRSGQLAPLPEKSHPWSDLADALQYLALVAHGGLSQYVANRLGAAQLSTAQRRPTPPVGAWT